MSDASNRHLFTAEERSRLRSDLLEYAANDTRLSGAAITGSAAAGVEDQWSDIDLAFGITQAHEVPDVLADWTAHMYKHHLALHHVDVTFGKWLYRVFLCPDTLQVDLAFAPASDFGALTPSFRLVFGKANELYNLPSARTENLIGLGWLYALHARTCIARGRLWQAEYMISSVRDNALALSCIRHGLSSVHGRGIDQLPPSVVEQFEPSLVRHLDRAELSRAFDVVLTGLLGEIRHVDQELADRLRPSLILLSQNHG